MTAITPYTIPSPTSPYIPHTLSSSQDSKQPLLEGPSSNFTVRLHKSLFTTANSACFRRICLLHRVNGFFSGFLSTCLIPNPKAFTFHPASSSTSSSYQRPHQVPQEASMSPLTLNEQLPAYSEIMMSGATSHDRVSEKRTPNRT